MTDHRKNKESSPTLGGEMRNAYRHSAVYMLMPAVSKVVGFLLFPIYTTYLSTSDFGISSLIEIAMMFAMLVMGLNLSSAMTRFYFAADSERARNQIVSSVFLGTFMTGLPFVLALFACSFPIANLLKLDHRFVGLLRWAFVGAWLGTIAELGFAFLRMRYMAKTFLLVNFLQMLLVICLNIQFVVFMNWGIAGIIMATVFAQACVALTLLVGILVKLKTKPSVQVLIRLTRFGIPLVPATVTQQLNNYIQPIMIQWISVLDPVIVASHVGIYVVGQKIGVVVNRFIVVPFNSYWMPRRMELVMQSNANSNRIIARICTYSTLATTAFALLVSAVSESFLQLLDDLGCVSDASYLQAHLVIPLIALAYAIHSLEHHFTTGMLASGKTRSAAVVGMASLAVILAVNFALIPRFGFVGAAIASVTAVTVRTVLFYVVSRSRIPIPFEIHRLCFLFAAAAVVFLVSRWIRFDSTLLTLLSRSLVSIAYLPLMYVLRFFDANEVQKIRHHFTEIISRTIRPILHKGSRPSL